MASPERSGLVEKYQGWNKITRNIAIVIAAGGLVIGNAALFSIAAASVAIDQAQIFVIDKWQNRKASPARA